MAADGYGVDCITIDGGEGGAGAAPLVFADHVALPFKVGFSRVYKVFAEAGVHEDVLFIGSGKLGFPETALWAVAMGCDLINVGREAILSIGCIQAQRCHTGHCPWGVATQNRWLTHGLDPTDKSVRLANYVAALRKELTTLLSRACGVPHPALVTASHLELLDDHFGSRGALDAFGYRPEWGVSSASEQAQLRDLMG
jgi:glutamate synthase domain-containing protein 2